MANHQENEAIELEGRLSASELAFFAEIRAGLRLGLPVRVVMLALVSACLVLFVVGALMMGVEGLPSSVALVAALFAAAFIDQAGLRFLRYRLHGYFAAKKAQSTVARFDRSGVWWAPSVDPSKSVALGWALIDVLSMGEGIVVVLRARREPILYVPTRCLTNEQRHVVELIARESGSNVYREPRQVARGGGTQFAVDRASEQ